MKKSICLMLVTIMVVSCLCVFSGCKKDESYTLMQMDTNPSVEFVLDADNKVVAVTALNADGAIIIAGEAFVGKTAEEAAKLYLQVCINTGYIDETGNDVTITVSADSNVNVGKIYKNVEATAKKFLNDSGITATIAAGTALTQQAMQQMVLVMDQTLTQLEVAALTQKELMNKIAESRKETAELLSVELREMYYSAKAYKFSFAEKEETKKVVAGVAGVAQTLIDGYNTLLTSYQNAIANVEQVKYDNLIDPECAYQKAVAKLIEEKINIVEKRNEIAEMLDGLGKTAAQTALDIATAALSTFQLAIDSAATAAELAFDTAITAMKQIETQLIAFEETFPDDVQAAITQKVADIETAANTAKDEFFTEFETQYAAAMEAHKTQAEQHKTAMETANGTAEE